MSGADGCVAGVREYIPVGGWVDPARLPEEVEGLNAGAIAQIFGWDDVTVGAAGGMQQKGLSRGELGREVGYSLHRDVPWLITMQLLDFQRF